MEEKKKRGRKKGESNKFSKHEKNKQLLSAIYGKLEKEEEVNEPIKKLLKRSFICSCGCRVTLEGETYNRKIKNGFELCSQCDQL